MKSFFEAIEISAEDAGEISPAAIVEYLTSSLTEIESAILIRSFGIDCAKQNYPTIAFELGISKSRIGYTRAKGIRKLLHPTRREAILAGATTARWARRDKDLQQLRSQVLQLSSKMEGLSAFVEHVLKTPAISKMLANEKESLDRPIDDMKMTVRTTNCLKVEKIFTIRELLSRSEKELLKTASIGRKSLDEIMNTLAGRGQSLRQ